MPKLNKNQIQLREVYKHYEKKVENPVDYKTHKNILDTWGTIVNRYLVEGRDVQLHERLSKLGVRKFASRSYVDFKASKIAGKEVRVSNIHSNFYGARVYWNSHGTRINVKGWVFRPTKELKLAIKDVMIKPQGHTTYIKNAEKHNKKAAEAYRTKILKL